MARDDMRIDERYQYLRRMQTQYLQASRKQRQALLDQRVAYTGLHRKSVIRRLHSVLQRQSRRRERAKSYGAEVDTALAIIWESLDHPCALRLQPNLVRVGKHLARHLPSRRSPASGASVDRKRLLRTAATCTKIGVTATQAHFGVKNGGVFGVRRSQGCPIVSQTARLGARYCTVFREDSGKRGTDMLIVTLNG